MIDEDRTLSLFGYTSDELSPKSHKPIIAVCEECGKYRVLKKQDYRDPCNGCVIHGLNITQIGEAHPMFGKHHTAEARERISNSTSGRSFSDDHKRKIGDSRRGADNPSWKGGVTSWRIGLKDTPIYKNWRAAVFGRDDFTCKMCNTRGANLQAHHLRPVRDHKNDLLIFDIDNGITLCEDCHKSINGKEYDFIQRFEVILS